MSRSDVTRILQAVEAGDAAASEQLLPVVYDELRRLAAARLASEQRGHTMQATELVHEAYLRLVGPANGEDVRWDGRAHFFAAAAESMRRILVDRARARGAAKRGGSWNRVDLDFSRMSLDDVPAEFLELDEALEQFKQREPEKAQLVSLRFFAGLTMEEAASVMGISIATANRHWAFARAWLFRELQADSEKTEID